MNSIELAENIRKKALECGFDNCGIISIDKMNDFKKLYRKRIFKVPSSILVYKAVKGLNHTKKRFTWGKSIIVCTYWYGKFQFPKELQGKYGKSYILSPTNETINSDYQKKLEFENWLQKNKIRYDDGGKKYFVGIGSLRHAAVKAGLGIIRKNNFFYTEKGSYYQLIAYVIDKECELIHENKVKQCSDNCKLCQNSCKTKALFAANTMSPLKCVSFWTSFGKGVVPFPLKKEMFEEWICGCDNCQDICPYNKIQNWENGEELTKLSKLVPKLLPEKIKNASDEFIIKEIVPILDNHLQVKDIASFRVNAKRSVEYKKAYPDG